MKKMDTVLLVDDDDIVSFVNRKIIEGLDIARKVEVFYSAPKALEYLYGLGENGGLFPRVILLDINMPVTDGFGFLDELINAGLFRGKPLDVFMLSSSDNPLDVQRAKGYDCCSGYIVKPLSSDKILNFLGPVISAVGVE